jgi:hypothetical protein
MALNWSITAILSLLYPIRDEDEDTQRTHKRSSYREPERGSQDCGIFEPVRACFEHGDGATVTPGSSVSRVASVNAAVPRL